MLRIVIAFRSDRVLLCVVRFVDYRYENQRGGMHVQPEEFRMSHWRCGWVYVSNRSGRFRRRRILFRKRAVGKKPQALRADRSRIFG